VYRIRMTDALSTSIAPELLEPARSTLAGAVAVAAHMPGALGAEVLAAARLAFVQSFDMTALLTAAISLLTAGMVVIVLRDDGAEDALANADSERAQSVEPAYVTAVAGCD